MPDRTSERGMKSLFAQKQCSALDVEAQPEFCLRVGPLRQSLRQTLKPLIASYNQAVETSPILTCHRV
jgi:hypothetical protein